ncbi:methyltransferase domain-containing protein [Ferruginibacter sp. HRS2-29]|uniref:class I SAM-dependent methyltransferase n=1 Tax=Ferruginibacter sp. HRS2-29 TaxID=2487334 RepID=UPI0020CBB65E|nr:methyltransferase domain-containing protein [Ferruginibacter sp. HRS2-29]MCP9750860.1 methyltransferase domain-containing protein [Ferruginibacter sp. HRS2-29]
MMQLFNYIKYFFYLASNWGLKIGIHIIRQEIRGEKKYGIRTTGADELKKLEEKGVDISHATIYMPASYDVLEELFAQITPSSYHHFIDIGCGKGRALCVAAQQGFTKVTGIDFSKELCEVAKTNLQKTAAGIPALEYKVINNDAFYFNIPPDADCIFLFNPFDEIIMSGVVNNIEKSLEENPRAITVIYLNSLHKELFAKQKYTEVYHTQQMKYLQGVIFRKNV